MRIPPISVPFETDAYSSFAWTPARGESHLLHRTVSSILVCDKARQPPVSRVCASRSDPALVRSDDPRCT